MGSEEKADKPSEAQVGILLRVLRKLLGKDVKRSDVVTLLTVLGAFGGGSIKSDNRLAAVEARLASIESAQRETLSSQITQRAQIELLAFRFSLAHPETGRAEPPMLPARHVEVEPAPAPEREAAHIDPGTPTRVR